MTHGFDDQGRQYDPVGNLRDWWSPESAAKFKERSQAIVTQYSEYEPLPGLHINGELTQGENIADLAELNSPMLRYKKRSPESREKKSTALRRNSASFCPSRRSGNRSSAMKI